MKQITVPLAAATIALAVPVNAQDETAKAGAEAAEAVGIVQTVDIEEVVEAGEAAVEDYEPIFPSEPRLRSWRMVEPLDYPIDAWRSNAEGIVDYTVEVDAEGKPTDCKVTKSSGSGSLDAAICPIVLERGKFRPAMAAKDQPIVGTYEGYHNWRKREPEMPQMSLIYRYTHGADGNSTNCEFLKMENLPEGMRKDIERDIENDTLCRNGPSRTRGIPYRDENGVPVAKIVTVTFDVVLEDPEEADKPAE